MDVHGWIADECSRSTVKNSLAALVRVMEQAVRDGIIDRNPARITGWQREYRRAKDELDDPRALALPNRTVLERPANALVGRSADSYPGWGKIVIFAACTAARIGEVSGVRGGDIDTWTCIVRRQITPSPRGPADKGTKGKRARKVPLITEVRQLALGAAQRRGKRSRGTAVHRPQGRADQHSHAARCHALGRGLWPGWAMNTCAVTTCATPA
ncbi:hypothetical protein [Nonomuraea rhizosphaerae]|uniref:hypothetical protein n=1 Tax=Nonomuraea rhizosphaerae TaxID=2665663 RepID=UPI001C5E622B|nr:hypothetical protein [Nonomuraea rhizosphaerae]